MHIFTFLQRSRTFKNLIALVIFSLFLRTNPANSQEQEYIVDFKVLDSTCSVSDYNSCENFVRMQAKCTSSSSLSRLNDSRTGVTGWETSLVANAACNKKPYLTTEGITINLVYIRANSLFNPSGALAQTAPQKEIDIWTDWLFGRLRPEMEGKKIQPAQKTYVKEWVAIETIVRRRLIWTNLSECGASTPRWGWGFTGSADELADAVFYARYSSLNGRKIRTGETRLAQEWNSIYYNFVWGC